MTTAAAKYTRVRRAGSASRFIVFIVVLAFALQSYFTQTHIHGVSRDVGGIAKIMGAKSPAQGKTPLDNTQNDCPFCQAVAHSGFFVASTTLLLHQPFSWIKTISPHFSARSPSDALAHDWQSRAPPLL